MKKFSLGALVASGLLMGGLTAGSASAADLGGNCCADLEERIAELEATTARKGNRKVSLTISGWVGEQVMWWDDGKQRNVYVTGLGTTLASHVSFTGQATIMPGWYAGYVLTLEADEADPLITLNQLNSTGPRTLVGGTVDVLQSFWFIKSDHLGKVSVGTQSPAGDNAAILVDGSGSLVPSNWVMFDNAAMFVRTKGGVLTGSTWGGAFGLCEQSGGIGGDCVSNPFNDVRYDSPVFAGFSLSADWASAAAGNPAGFTFADNCTASSGGVAPNPNLAHDCINNYWDVFLRYAGEYNGIKIAATTGYSFVNNRIAAASQALDDDVGYWQSGIYLEHVPTGVFVYGAYGREFWRQVLPGFNAEPDHWMVKAGLRERWSPLGHTVLYGSFAQRNDMFSAGSCTVAGAVTTCTGDSGLLNTPAGFNSVATSTQLNEWSLGAVQEIDAAAMSLWLQYDHFDGSVDGCAKAGAAFTTCPAGAVGVSSSLDHFQLVKFGALINF